MTDTAEPTIDDRDDRLGRPLVGPTPEGNDSWERVPYTDDMLSNAAADLAAQAEPFGDHAALQERYPKAAVGDFDGDPERLTEMDALIAYLQILGRMVDFADYTVDDLRQ